MFLPLDEAWAIDAKHHKRSNSPLQTFVSPATIAFKLLITWLYWDAGYGKYTDPLQVISFVSLSDTIFVKG